MRGSKVIRRPKLELDPKYRDVYITKLINKVMLRGKKETARRLVYTALERLANEQKMTPPMLLQAVIEKAAPILEVRSRRVGGATYQVPVEVRPERKVILVMRWLIEVCRQQSGQNFDEILYREMKNVLEGTGAVLKKREDLHKMAESNRAFAHFARY